MKIYGAQTLAISRQKAALQVPSQHSLFIYATRLPFAAAPLRSRSTASLNVTNF